MIFICAPARASRVLTVPVVWSTASYTRPVAGPNTKVDILHCNVQNVSPTAIAQTVHVSYIAAGDWPEQTKSTGATVVETSGSPVTLARFEAFSFFFANDYANGAVGSYPKTLILGVNEANGAVQAVCYHHFRETTTPVLEHTVLQINAGRTF